MGIGPKSELLAFPPPRRQVPASLYRTKATVRASAVIEAPRPVTRRRVVATRPDPAAQIRPPTASSARSVLDAFESRNATLGRALGYGWSVALGAGFFVWKLILVPMIGSAVAFVFEHHGPH